MEPIEVISSVLTGISIVKGLSKYFLPPKPISLHTKMEYIGGGTLKYNAEFELPKAKKTFFRRKRTLDPALGSLLDFITVDLRVEGNPLSKSLPLNRLLDWSSLIQDKELYLKPGQRIELGIRIPVDLDKYIVHERPTLDRQMQAQLKNDEIDTVVILVKNTLSIDVKQYRIIVPMPSRKLNRVCIRKGLTGQEHEDELNATLSFSTRVFCIHGDFKDQFPDINTSQMDTWINHKESNKEIRLNIPVDLEKGEKVLIVLYFD